MHASQTPTLASMQFRWLVFLGLILAAILFVPFDFPVAQFLMSDPLPGEFRRLIHKTEFFGHGYGILGIAFTIYLLCESRRRQILRLVSTAFAAGLLCNVVKICFHRVRPCDFSFAAGESSWRGLSFLHVDSLDQLFDSSYHSFPSAHTATAIAFALGLGAMYPKARQWFVCLATMCAISRFDGGAHYVSDTFIGAALGYTVAYWAYSQSTVAAWHAAYEQTGVMPKWPLFEPRREKRWLPKSSASHPSGEPSYRGSTV